MAREHPIRYVTAFLLAATGGVISQFSADALGADGLAAVGLFIACGVIFVLPATALTASLHPPSGHPRGRAGRPKR